MMTPPMTRLPLGLRPGTTRGTVQLDEESVDRAARLLRGNPTARRRAYRRSAQYLYHLALLYGLSGGSPAWATPIGIPHPGFGVDEVAPALPSPWTSDVVGFYYVKQGGTNVNQGFPASPRGTMPTSGVPVGAVIVMDNTVAFGSGGTEYTIPWAGTSSQPIFLQSSASSPRAIWNAANIFFTGTYVNMDFMDFVSPTSTGKGFVNLSGDHLMVRDSTIRGNLGGGGGTHGGGTGADPAHHLIWLRCLIKDNGDWQAASDQDSHGWSGGSNLNNAWIVDCEFFHNSGDGAQVNGGQFADAATHHLYFGRNLCYENKQQGLWSKGAVDVIFSQNICHTHVPSASSPGAGGGQQYGPDRVWWIFNLFHDNYIGIQVQSDSNPPVGTECFLVGNVVRNLNPASTDHAFGLRGSQTFYLVNNTAYEVPTGIYKEIVGVVVAENNIIDNVRAGGDHIFLQAVNGSTVRYDLFGLGVQNFRINWGGTVYTSLAAFQSGTGQGGSSLNADPTYVSEGAGNLRLSAGSQGINAGLAGAFVYSRFLALYGIDISVDFSNVSRPVGAAWDIGAFEYSSPISLMSGTGVFVH